jgi:regulator of protease activity HflC (stomatin/prohibitin superfamily)
MNKKHIIIFGFFILLIASLSCLGFEQVNAGHRGIKLVWGKVVSDSLPEGLYFYNPISTNIVTIDTRLQKKTTNLETYTKDIQQTTMYITVNFFVDPQNAHVLYQRIGLNYSNTLIEPALMSAVKDVVGKVEADKFINNRELVTEEIKQKLSKALDGSNVIIQSVSIEDIAFSGAFEAAIEAKQIATQEAIKSQNETVRVEEEGKQRVIKARAESDSKKAQSDAAAYAIEVESKAKAEAIRQMGLAESEAIKEKSKALAQNANLVELTKAERWNGALPQNIYGSGPVPFLNINGK